jgi:hypothetical protein
MQQSADKRSDCSWFRPSYSAVMYGAEVWRHEAVKDKMSAVVKKALRSILALHPRDCSSDVLYGDTGLLPPGVLIDAAKLCWQHRCKLLELADGPGALRFSFEGSRGVSRLRWARTGAVIHY